MEKNEALVERARLKKLLNAYEAGRPTRPGEDRLGQRPREATPDRAGNVRARIARLDQLITEIDDDQRS
jgi:hypothetical protein